jgi:hypothetical protein
MITKFISLRTLILLVLGLITIVAIDILLRLWFFYNFHLLFDAASFNNVATPLVSLISVVFLYLAFAQSRKQNRIANSQNLKLNFDADFQSLKDILSVDVTDRLYGSLGINSQTTPPISNVTSLNYIDELRRTIDLIRADSQFQEDNDFFLTNPTEQKDLAYYIKRNYYWNLRYILAFNYYPIVNYNAIEIFLSRIINSELLDTDRNHFKSKVESEFLKKYFSFIMFESDIRLPDVLQSNGKNIKWDSYKNIGIDKYYKPFRQMLKQNLE